MKDMFKKNKTLIICCLLVLIILIGGTYAFLRVTIEGTNTNRISAADLSLALSAGENKITIPNAYPLTDTEGMETNSYDFTVTNDGDIDNNYTIKLSDLDISNRGRMADEYVKCRLQVTGAKNQEVTKKLSDLGRTIDSGTLKKGEINHYKLQLWMDYDAPNIAQGTVFKAKIVIEGEQTIK